MPSVPDRGKGTEVPFPNGQLLDRPLVLARAAQWMVQIDSDPR
ncbi:hypothetical protein KR51_00031210 [Rubidibacter lacunae KORDI 51-2]|uniref:Uncharacterized protein n=1 Tax=Rubidibacter lacunae KORDI 51-2 TaxID=582515 RepID=U5DFJ0_9CHRO|nr:hypothetical protein KR51_00031210 [Rubidibacter lacunae KORDI 51-2]